MFAAEGFEKLYTAISTAITAAQTDEIEPSIILAAVTAHFLSIADAYRSVYSDDDLRAIVKIVREEWRKMQGTDAPQDPGAIA